MKKTVTLAFAGTSGMHCGARNKLAYAVSSPAAI